MRLATFAVDDGPDRVGVVDGDVVRPFADGVTMREVVARGLEHAQSLDEAAQGCDAVALSDVVLRVPLEPASIRDFVAFEEHVEGVRRSVDGAAGVPDAWYDA